MRTALLALVLLSAAACESGVPCDVPTHQVCSRNNRILTCGTDRTQFESNNCNAVLPSQRLWTCCPPIGEPTGQLGCRPQNECERSYWIDRDAGVQ